MFSIFSLLFPVGKVLFQSFSPKKVDAIKGADNTVKNTYFKLMSSLFAFISTNLPNKSHKFIKPTQNK